MEQLPKILYLTKDDKGLKLRRRVPANLRGIVGQSEWVERCSGIPWAEVKQRASLFAVRTDAKLKEARAQAARTQPAQSAVDGAPGFKVRPSVHNVEQIALAYFHERSRDQGDQIGRHPEFDSDEYRDAMEEAGLALREAELSAAGMSLDPREDRSSYYHRDAVRLLTRYGYLAERGEGEAPALADPMVVTDPAFTELVKLIGKAEIELALRTYKARDTQQEPPVTDTFFSAMVLPGADPRPSAGQKGHSLEELVRSFLAHKSREVGSSRLSQFNVPMRALTEELGPSFRVAEVTRAHCQELADLFVRVPSHATQHYKGLRLRDAAEAHKRKHGTYPSRFDEAEKGLATLRMVMEWAVEQDWIEANPAAKVKVVRPARPPKKFEEAEDEGYEPFSDSELQAIFTAPLFTGSQGDGHRFAVPGPTIYRRSRYWVPLIAVWSGMRLNEILQLERGDIKRQDGIAYFDVTDREELEYDPAVFSKRLKNTHSVRKVPVHAQLVRLGLLDWIDQRPSGRLFAEATGPISERPSLLFSKRFQTFLRSRNVWVSRTKVFHSLRNNFTDALRRGRVDEEFREAILGWSDKGKMDRRYGEGHSIARLKEEIDKAFYNGFDVSHLQPFSPTQ
jgi:integrase